MATIESNNRMFKVSNSNKLGISLDVLSLFSDNNFCLLTHELDSNEVFYIKDGLEAEPMYIIRGTLSIAFAKFIIESIENSSTYNAFTKYQTIEKFERELVDAYNYNFCPMDKDCIYANGLEAIDMLNDRNIFVNITDEENAILLHSGDVYQAIGELDYKFCEQISWNIHRGFDNAEYLRFDSSNESECDKILVKIGGYQAKQLETDE